MALVILSVVMLGRSAQAEDTVMAVLWVVVLLVAGACLFGLTVVNPNQAKVVQLFGKYEGSLKQQRLLVVSRG